MTELEAIILLSRVSCVSAKRLERLWEAGLLPEALVRRPRLALEICPDLSEGKLTESIEKAKSEIDFAHFERECERLKIKIVTFRDASYPASLKEIYDPPIVLYVKGDLISEDEAAVAVVGSRHPSPYGTRTAHRIAYELAEAGVTVVSGLARGIDGEAHRGALDARGRTIAILGSGIDVIYPKEHEKLYRQITESGAVVSEFPFGTLPLAHHFPIRNRLIAGFSLGVLVVEAHTKSGSLITASLAAELGREVYAIPGPIDSIQSRGTNALIAEGAKLARSSDCILEDLMPLLRDFSDRSISTQEDAIKKEETNPESRHFLELFGEGALTFDEIKSRSGLGTGELGALLSRFEFEKKLIKKPGGSYEPALMPG